MLRIGQSIDIHQLVENRELILGGEKILHHKGTLAHSDGDCLFHVITESIIGALGKGDLGEHFSDTDYKNKNLNSKKLLLWSNELLKKENYNIMNLDTIILCEQPKLSIYRKKMIFNIAKLLNLSEKQINIKFTTGEKIGIIGKEEAIICEAIILLKRKNE